MKEALATCLLCNGHKTQCNHFAIIRPSSFFGWDERNPENLHSQSDYNVIAQEIVTAVHDLTVAVQLWRPWSGCAQ
jgi:hypothetical protein